MSTKIAGNPGVAANVTFLDQCTVDLCPIDIAVMKYVPSLEANAAFAAVFSALLILQAAIGFFYKTHSFTFTVTIGLALEILGYLARVMVRDHMFTKGLFLVQIICLTVAPVFFTAALYLTVSRIVMHFGVHNSRLSPKAYPLTFIAADFIALILQSVGGGVADSAVTRKDTQTGIDIMVSGLSFQLFSLICFVTLCAEFFWRVRIDRKRVQNTNWAAGQIGHPSTDVSGFKIFLAAFMLSTVLIIARSAFRVAELIHGFQSKLANDEVCFMIFEGGLMIAAILSMTIFHPGRFLGEKWKESGWGAKKNTEIEMKAYDKEIDGPIPVETPVFSRPWPI